MNNAQVSETEASRRNQIGIASGCTAALGIWLLISPFVFGYGAEGPLWNNVIVGAVVVILAAMRLIQRAASQVPSWWNMALGVWMIVTSFLFNYAVSGLIWSNVIVGFLILIFAAWSGAVPARGRKESAAHHA